MTIKNWYYINEYLLCSLLAVISLQTDPCDKLNITFI